MLIDDDRCDAELIEVKLRETFDCHVVVVSTLQALLSELNRELPNVIISDSNVPGFSGMTALGLMQQMHPSIPFVFCSGNINPELRAKALADGAKAWVSKDDMQRLITVVKRVCGQGEWKLGRPAILVGDAEE